MVSSPPSPAATATKSGKTIKENLLTPRFYTTNFDVAASLDLSPQQNELEAMLAEMRADYNRHHFVRNESFNKTWENLDESTRKAFVDVPVSLSFLVFYCSKSCLANSSSAALC